MKLIFGLGNPGAKYDGTRHNIGFSILNTIAHVEKVEFKHTDSKYFSATFSRNNQDIMIIKPITYMNLSGEAVVNALAKHPNLTPNDILIVYDDIHLPIGKIRFRGKGSDGGHNGIKDITYNLQSPIYPRLRFGVNEPKGDLVDFVLGHFEQDEMNVLNDSVKMAHESILYWVEFGTEKTMGEFNSKDLRPPTEEKTSEND